MADRPASRRVISPASVSRRVSSWTVLKDASNRFAVGHAVGAVRVEQQRGEDVGLEPGPDYPFGLPRRDRSPPGLILVL
jgi:hypothetical protein